MRRNDLRLSVAALALALAALVVGIFSVIDVASAHGSDALPFLQGTAGLRDQGL